MADRELARDLGFLEAYTIGVGTMIGAGIFVLPSIAAQNAGPASMVSFLVGGVVSLLTALSLSELATGMPRAGGSYFYVNRALGSFFGSIVGWGMWAGLMFATAFYMLGFGQYLTYFYGALPVGGTALAMAALLVWINYRGVKEAGSLQNFIVIGLLGCIAVFLGAGLFEIDWQVFRPFNPFGWGSVAATAATVYVSFIGFEVIATSAEEIKDPARNLPLAMIASVLTPTALYVLVMLVCTGVLPVAELAASTIPVAEVAGRYLGPAGALMMVVAAVFATVSSANASVMSAARVNFAMGRDRILSDWLNEVHFTYRTPYRAILVTGAVILGLIALGLGIETLADVASFSYLLTYSLVHLAVIVMRRAAPADYRPSFRLRWPAYPLVPALGFVSCLAILLQLRPIVLLVGSAIVGLGVAWYWGYAGSRALKASLVGEAIVGEGTRAPAPPGLHRVVVPVANPRTERYLLRVAAATTRGHEEAELVAVNVIEVPPQTALSQGVEFEERRVKVQGQLLEGAREFARHHGIGLRTRAIFGRDVGQVILDVLDEEEADHLVLGWKGARKPREHILGSNLDAIAASATCTVTLVKIGTDRVGEVVALAGEGPYAVLGVRRASELVALDDEARLTLMNVQPLGDDGEGGDELARERGRAVIRRVARDAGIDEGAYRSEVVIAEDGIEEAILREVERYDTICVGATRATALTQAIFGSIPERVGERASGTVVIVRGPTYRPRTVTEAVVERLAGRKVRVR